MDLSIMMDLIIRYVVTAKGTVLHFLEIRNFLLKTTLLFRCKTIV